MASEFFGRQRECRFYTAGCGNKMVVSATGPRPANELGGPVIPGDPRGRYNNVLEFFFNLKKQVCSGRNKEIVIMRK